MHFRSAIFGVCLLIFSGLVLNAGTLTELPFEYKNGLVWVKVRTANKPLNFVLDSGAGASILDLRTAREIGAELRRPVEVQTVSGVAKGFRADGFSGRIGSLVLPGELLAIDLGFASCCCCKHIDGLLGQDFFKGRVVQIDYPSRVVRIMDDSSAVRASNILPLRYHLDAICVPVGVNGQKPKWTRLDTGCDSCLEWAEKLGRLNPEKNPKNTSLGLATSSGKATLSEVQLGTERIPNVKTGIHNSQIFAGEAGLLGNGLLSKYCVTIDTLKMRLLMSNH